MFNLAPIKYANCFESNGGPIHSIEESSVDINGESYAVSNARLIDTLRPARQRNQLFASIDGTGLDQNAIFARYKAISETIERWAHNFVAGGEKKAAYAFDSDPTSNGMAAFPGLLSRQTRKFALNEAIERYSIIAFWEGKIGASELVVEGSIKFYELHQPFASHRVVVSRTDSKRGVSSFGFGCGVNLESAKERAISEMERVRILLQQFYKNNPGFEFGDLPTIQDYMERRVIFFSMPEGVEAFEEKVRNSVKIQTPNKPKILYDGPIRGPWSKYAHVWRVAIQQESDVFLDPNELVFFW